MSILPIVAVPTEREEAMRGLVPMKHYLAKLRTSLLTRLHATYVQAGMPFVKRSDQGRAKARELMALRFSGQLERFAVIIGAELEVTEGQLASREEELKTMVAEHELVPYVMSIPEVGPEVPSTFLAYVGDGSRFAGPAQVANYIGFVPRIDCSGETNRY